MVYKQDSVHPEPVEGWFDKLTTNDAQILSNTARPIHAGLIVKPYAILISFYFLLTTILRLSSIVRCPRSAD